jgi:hypothetical protein
MKSSFLDGIKHEQRSTRGTALKKLSVINLDFIIFSFL